MQFLNVLRLVKLDSSYFVKSRLLFKKSEFEYVTLPLKVI